MLQPGYTETKAASVRRVGVAEAKMVDFVSDRYKKRLARMAIEQHTKWQYTLHAVVGQTDELLVNGRIVPVGRHDGVDSVRVKHNVLFQSYRGMLASFLQNLPIPKMAQGASGEQPRRMLMMCDRLMEWFVRDKEFVDAYFDAIAWASVCGTGFLGVTWDYDAGVPVYVEKKTAKGETVYEDVSEFATDENGEMVYAPSQIPPTPIVRITRKPKMLWVQPGDLRFRAPLPWNVFPQPRRAWVDVLEYIERLYSSRETLIEKYGSRAKALSPDVREDALRSFSTFDYGNESDHEMTGDMVRVLRYVQKPTKKYPHGLMLTIAGDMVLDKTELPGKTLPIAPIYDLRVPDSLWGESSLYQAVEAQLQLNDAETMRARNLKLHGNPALVADEGTFRNGVTRVAQVVGSIQELNRGSRFPQFLIPPVLPGWVEREPDRLRYAIEHGSGVHGVSKGESKGLMSGRQAFAVMQADAQKWIPSVLSISRAVSRVAEHALELWRENGPPSTTITVYGTHGSPVDAMIFHANYVPDNVSVYIDMDTIAPRNPETEKQTLVELFQIGAITKTELFKHLRFLGHTDFLRNAEPARAVQRQEIDLYITRNYPAQVLPSDDHATHMEVLLEWMNTPEFRQLDEQIKQLALQHLQQHEMEVLKKQQVMMGMQNGMGSPPPAPGPGGPGLAPTMNGAAGARTSPGVSGQERVSGYGG